MKRERPFQIGEVSVVERRFTDEDVLEFQRISGDAGRHHARPDAQGRRVVHGLLTATLPTRLGGDIDFLAREMQFEFLRPVFTGDTIRCEMTITEVAPEAGRVRLSASGGCWNQDGKEVLRFQTRGVVLDEGT
ncbi:enoyl-CoA hydratase [Sorangium cellulosum]|uniref:Enoyl-CoA hydratase n=1 Tax=Sorangium cellulosum TaxID=56 RepID=A0A2L0EZ17_SORCE|nr:hotdog domain-containing protein [Sorangium cellulosum]AUX44515.1 enoyl-CoA hydratase [Sorangium cellulosum]